MKKLIFASFAVLLFSGITVFASEITPFMSNSKTIAYGGVCDNKARSFSLAGGSGTAWCLSTFIDELQTDYKRSGTNAYAAAVRNSNGSEKAGPYKTSSVNSRVQIRYTKGDGYHGMNE
ncbi:MAG: hypothetical protein ACRCUP_07015 [Mycoplasmatales bacterium]